MRFLQLQLLNYVRMHQQFQDSRYLLGSPDIEVFLFLTPMSLRSGDMHFAMIWMSSTTLVNARYASSTVSNQAPLSCFFRQSGFANTVGAAATARLSHSERQPLLLPSAS